MWKFKFDAPKGNREYHYGFVGVRCTTTEVGAPELLWSSKVNKWVTHDWSCTHTDEKVINFRQFKKHLRKHPELKIRGVEVILCSRYYQRDIDGNFLHDYNIRAYWCDKYEIVK